MWTARVHKTGTVVQLLKDGKIAKTVNASDSTFSPITAKQFAENTVSELNKSAKQMTDPSKDPSITTKAEEQAQSLKAVSQDAKGKAVNASDNTITKEAYDKVAEENATLKRTLAKIQKESSIERKARRGLAIVKAMVEKGKIANDENVVKAEVEKIASMSNDEITVLERKASGNPPYESKDDANRAARRYARMARLHKNAAEDAQLGDDDELADAEDLKAAHYDELSKEAYNEAGKYSEAGYKNEAEGYKADDAINQAEKDAKGVDAQGKKASEEKKAETEMKPEINDTMFQADEEDDDDEDAILDDDVVEDTLDDDDGIDEDEEDFEDDDIEVEAAAKIYRKIASTHTEKAEALKKEGKEKEAAIEAEIAKEASEIAEGIEKEATAKQAKENEDNTVKTAAAIYRKIAADHRKQAEEYEAKGDSAKADEEDEIACEADELAKNIESDIEKTSETASEKTAEVKVAEEKVADEKVAETKVAEEKTAESKEIAKSADEEAKVEETTDEIIDKDAMVKGSEEEETIDEEIEDDTDKIIENTAKENAIDTDEGTGDLPSDEDIEAALAKDSNEETEVSEEEEAEEEVAPTRQIASTEKRASTEEQNPLSGQVNELENLWRNEK